VRDVQLLAQHGFGKTDKVEQGLTDGSINGVVISPRYESPTRLKDWATSLKASYPGALVLVDPQFYISAIPGAREGRLPEYPYFRPELGRRDFVKGDSIKAYVKETLDYQVDLAVDRLIGPTVYVESLDGAWAQVALTLMDEAQSYQKTLGNRIPLVLPICIAEEALHAGPAFDEFLDMLTAQTNAAGFYISVSRAQVASDPYMLGEHLGCLMYMAYILSAINCLETHIAYASFIAVPLAAVGTTSCASGWFSSLRRFSVSDLLPRGGAHPRERYSSAGLLNSILRSPELPDIVRVVGADAVFSNTGYDGDLMRNTAGTVWTPRSSALHHWIVLRQLVGAIESQPDLESRIELLSVMIKDAKSHYSAYNNNGGIGLETRFDHLDQWSLAIGTFREQLAH